MYKEFIGMICEFVSARPKWRSRLFEIFYKIFTWNLLYHVKEFESGDKTLVTTHHSKAVSKKSSFNRDDLGPRSHEEADYRTMLHMADMVKQNLTKIRIISNDTDVVVISLAFFHAITNLK